MRILISLMTFKITCFINIKSSFILYIVLGTYIIYIVSNFLATKLGILALIWYNFVYTPLKRKTALICWLFSFKIDISESCRSLYKLIFNNNYFYYRLLKFSQSQTKCHIKYRTLICSLYFIFVSLIKINSGCGLLETVLYFKLIV